MLEIKKYLEQKSHLQSLITDFIDNDTDTEEHFQALINFIENEKICQDRFELKSLLHLILKIAKDHHRNENFFEKIFQIILYFKTSIKRLFSAYSIFNIFRSSKRFLLFLHKENMIIFDENIVETLKDYSYRNSKYLHYFYPEVREFLSESMQDEIQSEIEKYDSDYSKSFEEKRLKGENDSYICELIRSDDIDKFISYVNLNCIQLSSHVSESIYETNSYLLKARPTLLEYSAFYGSSQIFSYLFKNRSDYSISIWSYAVHGSNPMLFNFLEENLGVPHSKDLEGCLVESIKCHNDDITEYIIRNYEGSGESGESSAFLSSLKYYNYHYFPNELSDESVFYDLCKHSHVFIVEQILKTQEISINQNTVNKEAVNKNDETIIQLLMKYKGIQEEAFKDIDDLKEINISSRVISIGKSAFLNCSALSDVIIPSSVTTIGDCAFSFCSALKRVIIPSTVVSIGREAFYGCSSLESLKINSINLIAIQDDTFFRCSSLSEILLPPSVQYIGNCAFKGCSSLKHLEIPKSVKKIGDEAFYWCSSLNSIKIPPSVEEIGKSVFTCCTSLQNAEIRSKLTSIKECTFYFCTSLENVEIPSSVLSINKCAFYCCKSLKSIIIPPSVKSIAEDSFMGCSSLHDLYLPPSITKIANDAFNGCSSLKQITIPSYTTVGFNAFSTISNVIFA